MSNKEMTAMNDRQDQKRALTPRLRFPEFRGAESWQKYFGDQVFEPVSSKQRDSNLPVLAVTQEYGAIPRDLIDYHVSVTDKSLESYKVVEKGDFIISLRSFQGGIEYSTYRGICSPAYVVLRKKMEGVELYFKHLFKTDRFIRELNRNLEGLRDGKMVSYGQFSELLLPIPSVPEQEKIADCLSSMDELITAEARKLDALKDHKKGVTQQLFPATGETVPRLRFPEFGDAGEWCTDSLGNTFETTSGGTPNRSRKEYWNGKIPWITTSLVDFNVIYRSDEFISEKGLENSSAKVFPKGTILIAMYGQGKTRGKVAILGIEAASNQACAAILPKKEIVPAFVFLNLGNRYDEMRELSNSGGQENLSQGLIRELQFSFPRDIAEQQEITDCLTFLDELITAQSRKIDALKAHKKGLMEQLVPVLDEVQG
jgi:type I restriction enzyme S subunit